jgi:hypothetical protein
MPGEDINLANLLTRVQFAQDAAAIFQGTDEAAKEERIERKRMHALQAAEEVDETAHAEGKTVHKIAEDLQRSRNFDEMLEEARRRLEEHKHSAEEKDKPGPNVDVII